MLEVPIWYISFMTDLPFFFENFIIRVCLPFSLFFMSLVPGAAVLASPSPLPVFWMKIFVFCRFLDQIRLQKTVFWTNRDVFVIQYLNILQLIKTVVDAMCVLFYKKIKNWLQKHFSWDWQKIIKYFAKKSIRVFKCAIFGILEHPKTFFWQNVLLFFFSHSWKMLLKTFLDFL